MVARAMTSEGQSHNTIKYQPYITCISQTVKNGQSIFVARHTQVFIAVINTQTLLNTDVNEYTSEHSISSSYYSRITPAHM